MHEEKPRGFLEELQSLNAVAKKRVLVISTILIMVMIVIVWFSYFNGILAATSESPIAEGSSTAVAPAANGPSIWQNIKNSMASIGNVFNSSSQYTVQPSATSSAAAAAQTN